MKRRKKDGGKQAQYRRELVALVQKIAQDRHLLHDFLVDLLTPVEYDELALRWQIVQQLHNDTMQRDVVDALGAAVATVTRGARTLRNPHGGFNRVLRKQ